MSPFEILKWWREHQAKYPKLVILACKILSVPASSAACERAFSAATLSGAHH